VNGGTSTIRVDVNGASLHVEVDGSADKPALLLWPPGRCTVRVWDHLVPRLIDRFRVVRIDIRGFGESSPAADPDTQYTFEQYAKDACDVLDHLGIDTCHVWSQSWGSRAAMVFCAFHPDRVVSAALYAANTDPPDMAAQQEGTKRAAELRRQRGIETGPRPSGFTEHRDPEAAGEATGALRRFDLSTVVEKLSTPILIGTGSHDPNLASSRVIAATVPNAKLAVLDCVGHNATLEHPEFALETFLGFHDELGT